MLCSCGFMNFESKHYVRFPSIAPTPGINMWSISRMSHRWLTENTENVNAFFISLTGEDSKSFFERVLTSFHAVGNALKIVWIHKVRYKLAKLVEILPGFKTLCGRWRLIVYLKYWFSIHGHPIRSPHVFVLLCSYLQYFTFLLTRKLFYSTHEAFPMNRGLPNTINALLIGTDCTISCISPVGSCVVLAYTDCVVNRLDSICHVFMFRCWCSLHLHSLGHAQQLLSSWGC